MRKFTTIIFFLASLSVFSQKEKVQLAFDFLKEFQNVRDIAISQNQEEVYFTIQSNHQEVSKIAFSKKINNNWTKPELVSFSSAFRDLEPFLSTDGLRLYFASNRPLNNLEKNSKDYDIWYVERKNLNSEWSKPINIGFPINTKNDEFYPSVTKNENIYFTSVNEKSLGKDDIFVSQFTNGSYAEPKNLGTNINSEGYEFNAYVSPEETFIIFTGYNRKDGNGSGDLYISYNKNGNWSLAENLSNAINSNQMDYCPFYDINSNTLYFTSKRNSIQDKKFDSIEEFQNEISKVENGFSRIYKVNIKL
jgi:hypothetical protein